MWRGGGALKIHATLPAVPPVGPNVPDAPANLSVTPGDGYLDIAWDAVTDATGYDVRAKKAGASDWHDVASNITTTSHRYTTTETIDYVAVRARNANGPGPWAELSRMPAHNWLTTVQQTGGASMQAASNDGAQAQSKLAAPTWSSVKRDNYRKHTLQLDWTAVTGATGYNVVCSDEDGWKWWQCGSITSQSTTTLTVSSSRNGTDLGQYRSYKVGVRAVNSNPSDASNWTNSANIRPVNGWLYNLTATRGAGTITLSWTPNPWTTGYQIDCAIHRPGIVATYTRCATLTGQVDTAAQHSVTIPHSSNSSYTVDNTKTYDIRITSTNKWDTGGNAQMFAPLVHAVGMSVADVSQTTAKLKVANYNGAWWYKRAAPTGDTTCHSIAAGTTEASLSGLTAGVAYNYEAFSKANCNEADHIASANFSTGASVSNLSQASDTFGVSIHSTYYPGIGFTTGDNESGYTLQSVTAKFNAKRNSPSNFQAAIHASASGNPADARDLHTRRRRAGQKAGIHLHLLRVVPSVQEQDLLLGDDGNRQLKQLLQLGHHGQRRPDQFTQRLRLAHRRRRESLFQQCLAHPERVDRPVQNNGDAESEPNRFGHNGE